MSQESHIDVGITKKQSPQTNLATLGRISGKDSVVSDSFLDPFLDTILAMFGRIRATILATWGKIPATHYVKEPPYDIAQLR